MSILKGARVNDALREDDDLLRRETHLRLPFLYKTGICFMLSYIKGFPTKCVGFEKIF